MRAHRRRRVGAGARLVLALGAAVIPSFVACSSADEANAPPSRDSSATDAATTNEVAAPSNDGPPVLTNDPDAAVDAGGTDAADDAFDATSTPALACSAAELVTSAHRYEQVDGGDGGAVYGGWGAHLGHFLRSAAGDEWFVDDSGNDVSSNAGLAYFKETAGAWSKVATATFPARVQQNTGSVIAGSTIFSYGVEPDAQKIAECTFDASTGTSKGCTELAFATGQLSNYVGATIAPDGTRVVWWTNTTGSFRYIYNFGGGWNGPVVSTLPGYADFSYVFARLSADDAHLTLFGSAAHMQGGASVGYDALVASTTLGTAITNWQNVATDNNAQETWLDPQGGAHFFAFTAGAAAAPMYIYQPKGGAVTSEPSLTESAVISARIVETATTANLVLSFSDGTVRRRSIALAAVTGAVDWNALPSVDVAVPASLGSLTLYPESAMYQTSALHAAFAMNGLGNQGDVFQIGCE